MRSEKLAGFFFYRDPGVVAGFLMVTCDRVEQGGFSRVGIARQCHGFQLLFHEVDLVRAHAPTMT